MSSSGNYHEPRGGNGRAGKRSVITGIGEILRKPLLDAFAVAGHRRVIRRRKKSAGIGIPIISVGNISFGGTAKTPMVEHLARYLAWQGYRPGIVLRGYLGRIDRERLEPEVVSDGTRVILDWNEAGDEGVVLAEALGRDGVPVAIGRDRISAAKKLMENFGIDIVLLDDGFQYTDLTRDFDLALIDSIMPFGRVDGGQGVLREPVEALGRADAILLTRSESVEQERIERIHAELDRSIEKLPPVFEARTRVKCITDFHSGMSSSPESLEGKKVVTFAGIGNPLGFKKTVWSLGCEVRGMINFPDHHRYTPRDIEKILRLRSETGAEVVLTTSKDAVRLEEWQRLLEIPLFIVNIEMVIDAEDGLIGLLSQAIGSPVRA